MTDIHPLNRWLSSEKAEAPYIVSAARPEYLHDFFKKLTDRDDLEVLTLPAEEATITIKQVRDLFSSLTTATLAYRRLVLIAYAERLSAPAAAALLKHLEEPARTTRYLLTTVFPQRLLPTILSRCQRFRLHGGEESSEKEADDIQRLAQEWEARLRQGEISPAMRLAFTRLCDYYRIVSLRGNEKMARDVLVASAPPDEA